MAGFPPNPQYTPPVDEATKRFTAQWTDWFAKIEQYITLTGAYGGGVLPATAGGTGFSSYAIGDILYAATTTTLARRAAVATGNALISGGINTAPTWGKVGLATHVSGILPVANGGTALASGTSGGVLAYTAAGTLASSAALTASALVLGGGAGAVPTVLGSLGTTTTVLHGNAAGAPTFSSVSLTADVAGVLPVANGGTGSNAFQHARVTTGSVAAGSTALVTVTWNAAFADANYTATASVVESTTSSLSMSVVHIESVAASAITVRVLNNALGALTGTVHAIAVHD